MAKSDPNDRICHILKAGTRIKSEGFLMTLAEDVRVESADLDFWFPGGGRLNHDDLNRKVAEKTAREQLP
jgi:hypothetical protein